MHVPKTSFNVELLFEEGGPAMRTSIPITLQEHVPDPYQMWRFEPTQVAVEGNDDEILYTTATTTVTKVKMVTRIKRSS